MKRVIKALACIILAVLVLLGVKNEYARLLPASTYGMQAAIRKGQVTNLFIGSSMFRQGLSIDVLEEELPGTSYILSYNGNQPAFIARELEYMLEQGLRAENLYIDLYPYTAAATPWISDTKIILDTDLSFKVSAWKLMSAYNDTSFSDFYELFVTANNEQILTYPIHNRLVSAQFRNGGNILTPAGGTKEYLDSLGMLGGRDGLCEAQVSGYQRIVELAGQYGMKLYFIETPKYERMYQDNDYLELYHACVKELQELGVEENGLPGMILSEDLDFDNSHAAYYQDLIHLSTEGRTEYTRLLCEQLLSTQ
jgi:hypothetical protein